MFIKDTFKFIIKNPRLILPVLVPAAFLGVFSSPSAVVPFIFDYRPGGLQSLAGAFAMLSPIQYPIWLLLLIPVTFVFCAAALGLAEHKMRVGNYGFRGFWQRMNFGVTAILVPFMLAAALYAFWLFLSSCILVFIEYIFFTLAGSAAASTTLVILFTVLLYILLILMFTFILLWAPVILVSGYGITDSWYYQLKLITGKIFKFALAAALPFFINSAVITTSRIFLTGAAMAIVNVVCFAFLIIYLISLSMTAYFNLSKTPRKDIQKKYYL